MIGIYSIRNLINNKRYIGKSKDVRSRTYMFCIPYDERENYRNEHLKNSIKKYGIENFVVEILEECQLEQLNEREIYWIAYYKSHDSLYGYNKTFGGEGGNQTQETKDKIYHTLKNKYPAGTHYMIGFKQSDETRAYLSKLRKGKPVIPKGSNLSDTTKQKLIIIRTGRVWMTDGKREVFIPKSEISYYESLGYHKGRVILGRHYHPGGLSEATKQKLRVKATGKKYKDRRYHLICKSCFQEFLGTSPRQYYCENCKMMEVV